ncbi:MAG: hypothetical protein SangKO_058970 [Sandaracinaceae bacterium]
MPQEVDQADHPRSDADRLRSFLGHLIAGCAVAVIGYLVVGIPLQSAPILYTAAVTMALGGVVWWARRRAQRGHTEHAATTVAIGMLLVALLVAPVFGFLYPTLVLVCLLAVVIAIPYVDRALLRVLVPSAVVAAFVVSVVGLWQDALTPVPLWAEQTLLVVTSTISVYLNITMMVQVHRRLRETLQFEREATEELGRVNRQLEVIVESSPAAILLLRLDGTVLWVNPAFEQVFGWRTEDLVGQKPSPVTEETEPEFRANMEKLAAGETLRGVEVRRKHKDGRWVDTQVWAAPVQMPEGDTAVLSVIVDVTARKEAERRLEQERSRAEEASQAARVAERRKDEFLAMLGHELRNPLAPITTALEVVKMSGDETHEREHAIIARHVRHMTRLVDDLLDVSRITRGKLQLRRRKIDLRGAIDQAVEMTAPLFEEKRHRLELDVPNGFTVKGDPTRLAQIFSNLLSNAAKYSEPEGVVTVRATAVSGSVKVTVADEGIGMSEELAASVFDLFVQAEQAIDRASGGLGLGLTLVRSLTRLHDGEVTASSPGPGRGSTFEVRLPLAMGVLDSVDSLPPQEIDLPSVRRVLVVDDNEDAAELLAHGLRRRGFEVELAFDGPSAIDVAREFLPDAAILDIGLPVMDGYELAGRLTGQLAERPRLVAVTGYGQQSDRDKSAAAGFDVHLVKPVQMKQVLDALKKERPSP